MLAPPDDLPEEALREALLSGWGIEALGAEYVAVGFGSHHWRVDAADGGRWFVTVDELKARTSSSGEDAGDVFHRLRAALRTARAVADGGAPFVVPPVAAGDGEVVRRLGERLALAVYPFVTGRSWPWGDFESYEQRLAVMEVVAELHRTGERERHHALVDDFAIRRRDGLLDALARVGEAWDAGPYSEPARDLLARHAEDVVRLLARYDRLAAEAGADPGRMVLTHGEPHVGNVLLVDGRYLLVDWDTALVAPPERDLCMIDLDDNSVSHAYALATGVDIEPGVLDLYRLRWVLAEIAIYITEFDDVHDDDPNTRESWKNLEIFLPRASEL